MSFDVQVPEVIGVLDLMDGVAVRAVGGRRSEYQPVESRLCGSSDPIRIAEAFRDQYGVETLYVADLDAIVGRGSNSRAVDALKASGFRIALDAGLQTAAEIDGPSALPVDTIIAGLETLASLDELQKFLVRVGRNRLAFSLDLAGGLPILPSGNAKESSWHDIEPLSLARRAIGLGLTRVIVLDLHAVGGARGPVTTGLCEQIRREWPTVTLWTGGGIRSAKDIRQLGDAGVDGVLVASALHDGLI